MQTWLSFEKMLWFESSDLWHSRENVRTVYGWSLNAVSMVDATITSFLINVELEYQERNKDAGHWNKPQYFTTWCIGGAICACQPNHRYNFCVKLVQPSQSAPAQSSHNVQQFIYFISVTNSGCCNNTEVLFTSLC